MTQVSEIQTSRVPQPKEMLVLSSNLADPAGVEKSFSTGSRFSSLPHATKDSGVTIAVTTS